MQRSARYTEAMSSSKKAPPTRPSIFKRDRMVCGVAAVSSVCPTRLVRVPTGKKSIRSRQRIGRKEKVNGKAMAARGTKRERVLHVPDSSTEGEDKVAGRRPHEERTL